MDDRAHAVKPASPAARQPAPAAPGDQRDVVRPAARDRDPGDRRAGVAGLVPDRPAPQRQQRPECRRTSASAAAGSCSRRSRKSCPIPRSASRFWGKGIEELSHVENLPQRVPILLAAGLIAAAAVGLGRPGAPRPAAGSGPAASASESRSIIGLGAGLLGVVTLDGRAAGMARPLVVPGRARVARRRRALRLPGSGARSGSSSIPRSCLFGLVIAPFVVVMILGSMLPTIDFDVLEYHLQGPKEYYQAGRIAFLPHNVYTNMPFGVEMLHLLGMEVLGDWWWGGLAGQLLVALFAPAAAVLIAATASRGGSARAAWIAAIVYLSTPWIYRLAVIAYVEGPLCFYHAALVWAAVRGWADRSMLAAAALGTARSPGRLRDGLQVSGADLGGDPVRSPRAGRLLAEPVGRSGCSVTSLGWAVVMGPWLGKNVIDTGQPGLSARQSDFSRPLLGPGQRDAVVGRPRPPCRSRHRSWGARWSTSPAGPTGSRRSTSHSLPWPSFVRARAGWRWRSGDSWPTCS